MYKVDISQRGCLQYAKLDHHDYKILDILPIKYLARTHGFNYSNMTSTTTANSGHPTLWIGRYLFTKIMLASPAHSTQYLQRPVKHFIRG